MATQTNLLVRLRVIVENPPASTYEGKLAGFGLQDKEGQLASGVFTADGARQFETEANAEVIEDGTTDFSGKYVHGGPNDRFLYVSLRDETNGEWIKRLKVGLSGIPWAVTQGASGGGQVLQARVDGAGAAQVDLIGGGWTVTM